MSLVTIIRDYVDVANSSEQLDGYTFSSLAYYTLGFIFSILKQVIVNFCTFQWIRDFSYFCLTPPMLFSSFANINISEGYPPGVEHQSLSNLVAFSETHFLSGIGLIFLGFFNGCFTSIHISAANLITIQRLLVNGVPAGLYSALGTAIGQCFFLASVHFGFRTLLFPWLSIEPLPFLLGIGILFAIASSSAQDRRTPTIQWSAKSYLVTCIFTSVALAWCEQTALFQLMGNLSFGAEPTLLETTPGTISNAYPLGVTIIGIIKNGSYLLAFFFGNFLGTFFLAYALQRLLELLLSFKGIPIYYGLIKQANLPLATLIFAFGFGSLPYYGFDYLITKGFGFIPQEQFFKQTLFSPVNLVSKTSQSKEPNQGRFEDQLALLFTLEGEKKKSFVVDTTPFDDGQYLKTGQKRPQAFEDLNYRGEHLWTNRLARISSIKEQANPTQSSFLGPAFSWMRSFLWGEGPNTPSANSEAYANTSVTPSEYALEGYNNFNNENFRRKKELSIEGEQLDNYVTEFERQFDKGFSNFHNAKPISLIEVEDQWQEQRIKKKCYTNPIYKFLLNIEIDSFLGRQPNYHRLSAEEEILLLKRRQLLSDYYDTLVLTSQIPLSQAFDQLVPKSYTNTVYNHQFKGTLKIARRLFSIKSTPPMLQASKSNFSASSSSSLTPTGTNAALKGKPEGYASASSNFSEPTRTLPSGSRKGIDLIKGNSKEKLEEDSLLQQQEGLLEEEKSRILKFDQPLFSKEKILSNSVNSQLQSSDFVVPERSEITEQERIIFHEELNSNSKENKPEYIAQLRSPQGNMRLSKTTDSLPPQDVGITKGAQSNSRLQKSTDKNVFLLEQAESLPLYASWDEELRKLILTNRFQSRIKAGYTYSAGQDFPMQSERLTLAPAGGKDSRITGSLDSNTSFTAWPLPNPLNDVVIPRAVATGNRPAIATVSPSHTSLELETLQENNTLAKRNGNISDSLKRNDSSNNNVQKASQLANQKGAHSWGSGASNIFKFVQNLVDSLIHTTFHAPSFLFPTQSIQSFNYNKEPAPNDMINALLQWQKLIKDNKQLSKEDKQVAKEKIAYWPKNVRRANWSTELMDNDIEFDEPAENALKKQKILWEFIPPNYGGFIWPGVK